MFLPGTWGEARLWPVCTEPWTESGEGLGLQLSSGQGPSCQGGTQGVFPRGHLGGADWIARAGVDVRPSECGRQVLVMEVIHPSICWGPNDSSAPESGPTDWG